VLVLLEQRFRRDLQEARVALDVALHVRGTRQVVVAPVLQGVEQARADLRALHGVVQRLALPAAFS